MFNVFSGRAILLESHVRELHAIYATYQLMQFLLTRSIEMEQTGGIVKPSTVLRKEGSLHTCTYATGSQDMSLRTVP